MSILGGEADREVQPGGCLSVLILDGLEKVGSFADVVDCGYQITGTRPPDADAAQYARQTNAIAKALEQEACLFVTIQCITVLTGHAEQLP